MDAFLRSMMGAVAQGSLWAVMCLGAYIGYKVLNFADLSIDGTFALGGAVSAALIANAGMNPFATLPLAMLAGLAGGLCTALLHTKLKIPGLLSGILTMLSCYSINLRILNGSNIQLLKHPTVIKILSGFTGLQDRVVSVLVGLALCALLTVLLYWFFGTEVGCALRATGDNDRMARALGVNTDNMIILGLMLSNALVGLSGALAASYQGFASVDMGTGTMVMGLASIIIGGVLFRFLGRSFWAKLASAVLGSIAYRVIIALVLRTGMHTDYMKLLTAVLVAAALALPMIQGKLRSAAAGRKNNAAA